MNLATGRSTTVLADPGEITFDLGVDDGRRRRSRALAPARRVRRAGVPRRRRPAAPGRRATGRRWLHHGSSISQGSNAATPSGTWSRHRGQRGGGRAGEPRIRWQRTARPVRRPVHPRHPRRPAVRQDGHQHRQLRPDAAAGIRPGRARVPRHDPRRPPRRPAPAHHTAALPDPRRHPRAGGLRPGRARRRASPVSGPRATRPRWPPANSRCGDPRGPRTSIQGTLGHRPDTCSSSTGWTSTDPRTPTRFRCPTPCTPTPRRTAASASASPPAVFGAGGAFGPPTAEHTRSRRPAGISRGDAIEAFPRRRGRGRSRGDAFHRSSGAPPVEVGRSCANRRRPDVSAETPPATNVDNSVPGPADVRPCSSCPASCSPPPLGAAVGALAGWAGRLLLARLRRGVALRPPAWRLPERLLTAAGVGLSWPSPTVALVVWAGLLAVILGAVDISPRTGCRTRSPCRPSRSPPASCWAPGRHRRRPVLR